MGRGIVLAVLAACGESRPPVPRPPSPDHADAAPAPVVIDAATPVIDAVPPAPPDAATIAIDVAQCPTAPIDGVAKGMRYDCGAFVVTDVTSPQHVPLADLVATLRRKSAATGA